MNNEHATFVIEMAYQAINGAILMAALGIFGGCLYAWYRFFKWTKRRWLSHQ